MEDEAMIDSPVRSMEFHEVADLFPMMDSGEYQALVADIKSNGLLEPIWIYQGKIIDGRNRYRACCDSDVTPRFREWNGQGSLVSFVVGLNLNRRHLTSGQKAMIALDVEKYLADEAEKHNGGRPLKPIDDYTNNEKPFQSFEKVSHEPIHAAKQAAKITGTNHQYVVDAKKIAQHPKLAASVKSGDLTIPQAKRQIKEQAREERRDENRQEIAKAKTIDDVLGTAKFSTIVLDPPWDWGDEGDVDQLGRAKPTYGTMSLQELLDLPVAHYADDNCHLYLWITNRSLPKGFQLLEKWGFRYITCITWIKPYFGMGNYFRGQTEHLLFGVKGSQMLKRKDAPTYFEAPRGPKGHSSKPLKSYDFIESCSHGPYLELFARSNREDWTSWGAEV